jgi:hypothetical protein
MWRNIFNGSVQKSTLALKLGPNPTAHTLIWSLSRLFRPANRPIKCCMRGYVIRMVNYRALSMIHREGKARLKSKPPSKRYVANLGCTSTWFISKKIFLASFLILRLTRKMFVSTRLKSTGPFHRYSSLLVPRLVIYCSIFCLRSAISVGSVSIWGASCTCFNNEVEGPQTILEMSKRIERISQYVEHIDRFPSESNKVRMLHRKINWRKQ